MEEHRKFWQPNRDFDAVRKYTSCSSQAYWPEQTYKLKDLITNNNLPAGFNTGKMANGSSWSRSSQCNDLNPSSESQFQDLWSDPVDYRSCVLCQREKYSSEMTSCSSTEGVAVGRYPVNSRIQEDGYIMEGLPHCGGQLSCWNSQGSMGEDCNSITSTIWPPGSQPSQSYENLWSFKSSPEMKQPLYTTADPIPPDSRSTNSSTLEPFSALSITSQAEKYLSTISGEENYLPFPVVQREKSTRRSSLLELTSEPEKDFRTAVVSQAEYLLPKNGQTKPIGVDYYLDGTSGIAVLISDETKYIQSLVDDDKYRLEGSNRIEVKTTNGYETSSSDNAQNGDQDQDQGSSEDSVHESINESSQEREAKDQFLIEQKNAGKTYKQIRKEGKFRIAESTLRGRYRNLTKEKVARVRKPTWKIKDIHLLKEAMRKFSEQGTGDLQRTHEPKAMWKRVADYIAKNGGSYQFGNATCKKKWETLQEEEGLMSDL